jgi:glycosyltransferase involved in cell wall biosynthesis
VHPRSFLPSLADRYFLYVGNAKEHKNVSFLIDAFIKAELTGIDLVLVMNGKEALSLPHFSHIHFFSGLSETHLLALYRHSLACVTASQLEGFCLPVIEAMNERTRVLAPSIPPFPEVCEGHAHLVSLSLDSFSTGFQMIAAESPEERTKALDTAHIFVKRYSWKKAAEEVRGMLTEEAEEK